MYNSQGPHSQVGDQTRSFRPQLLQMEEPKVKATMLLLCSVVVIGCGFVSAAPFSGTMTAVYGNNQDMVNKLPHHAVFTDSLGNAVLADPNYSRRGHSLNDINVNNVPLNMDRTNAESNDGTLVRRRRLADDKRLDLKMKMQRVKKVVSLDAIGSYSLFRSDDRKTSLKAFGSTELWYDGSGFGLKKPGLGVQFTIYY